MSKQSGSRLIQGYTEKPVQHTCANCLHRSCDWKLPAWMEESNRLREREGSKPVYNDHDRTEQNQRCTVGNFAVKKMATCLMWEKKEVKSNE